MPINKDSLNRRLEKALSRYDVKPVDDNDEVIPLADEAAAFKFFFIKDGENYGLVYVTIDDTNTLTVWFNDEIMDSPDSKTPGVDYNDTWFGFLQFMKRWAMNNQLSFKTENKDHLGTEMARRRRMKEKEKIAEGYYSMGKKASYSDAVPSVKIVLQHSKVMQEGEQRFRHIEKIFVENANGERFLVPTTKPGLARVFARHIAEGGTPYDERASHIQSLVEEYNKMAGFVRATRSGQFNESAQQLVQEGINHYVKLRESLGKLTGHRGYTAYFESWTPSLMEDEADAGALNELFVQETLDPRIESVMPILNRLHKKVAEMKEVGELSEWADSLLSEKMVMGADTDASSGGTVNAYVEEDEGMVSNNPQGIPESIADDYEDMSDRELMRHARMLGLEKNIVPDHEGGLANRSEIIYLLQQEASDDLDEGERPGLWANIHAKRERIKHGSGEKMRKPGSKGAPSAQDFKDAAKTSKNEGIGDVAKKVGGALKKAAGKAIDTLGHGSDEELLRDLKKRAGVRNPESGKPSMAHSDVEKRVAEGWDPDTQRLEQDVRDALDNGDDYTAKQYAKMAPTPEAKKYLLNIINQAMYLDDLGGETDWKGVAEDLDANQKRVGQLGPTEKVGKKGAVGKLVGANESFINTDAQAVVSEMDSQGYKGTRDSDEGGKGEGKATPVKAKDVVKKGAKALGKAMKDTHPDYNKHEKKLIGKMSNAEKADKGWRNPNIKEGQEDLDAILRIIRK